MQWFARVRKLPEDVLSEIEQAQRARTATKKGKFFIFLRVLGQDFFRNRLPNSAASLAYYSLLALGPMLAIIVMVSGFVLQGEGKGGYSRATVLLSGAVSQILPEGTNLGGIAGLRADQTPPGMDEVNSAIEAALADMSGNAVAPAETTTAPDSELAVTQLDPEIVELVDGIVAGASSGTLGLLGTVGLIPVVLLLLINVEKTFNIIWGVRQGRTMVQRVVFYWTLITLGAIVAFTAVSLKAGEVITNHLSELPSWLSGSTLLAVQYGAPMASAALIIVLLAMFYRFIPNTHVEWKPSLLGALVTAFAFWALSQTSFLLAGQFERLGTQWGPLALPLILLVSLYFVWIIILFGGQLTYATQNMGRLANQKAWEGTSVQARELLCLAVLAQIARRFHDCQHAPTADELSENLEVPGQVVNEALFRLTDMELAVPLERSDDEGDGAPRYQPCRPLERITLASFRERFATLGVNQGADLIDDIEPVLTTYREELKRFEASERSSVPLSRLIEHLDEVAASKQTHIPGFSTGLSNGEASAAVVRSN